MKKVICLTIISFIATISFGQNLTFSEVVEVDSLSKKQIYNLSKEWFAHAFNSAQNVIQYENAEEGKLIGKGTFKYKGKPMVSGTNSTGPVTFTITIESKDNRYKFTLTDFSHSLGVVPQDKPKGIMNVAMKDLWKDCNKESEEIINSLKKYITNKSVSDNNW